jgi:hypothetical protein
LRRAPVVLSAIAILGVGCGGSDEDQVEDTVETYLSAVVEGDGEEACEQLSGRARRQFLDDVREFTAVGTCSETMERITDQLNEVLRDQLEDAEVGDVTIDGETGTVRLEGSDRRAAMRKVDGEWKIDDFNALRP